MKTYELILRNETERKVAKDVGGAGGIQTADGANESTGGEVSSSDASAEKILKQVFGYKAVKRVVSTAISYQVSTVQLRTGSSEAQQRAQMAYSIGSQVFNIGESVVMGAVVGNLPGAIVGAILGITNTIWQYEMQQNTLNLQHTLEQNAQDLSAQRATISGSRYQNATME